jgi:hypothetical protein
LVNSAVELVKKKAVCKINSAVVNNFRFLKTEQIAVAAVLGYKALLRAIF